MRDRAPEVVHLDRQDDVRLADQAPAEALIERMPRREIHAPGIVDDAALQRFGKIDEVRHSRRRARHAIADDERVLRLDQHLRRFGEGAGFALRRNDRLELRDAQALRIRDRIFLQLGVEREEDRPHRRRRRDLVGAHRRLGEMLQRGRLIVPLGEFAHDARRYRRPNAPTRRPARACPPP